MSNKTKSKPISQERLAELEDMLISMLAQERGEEAIRLMMEMFTTMSRENTELQLRLQKQLKARFGQSSEKVSGAQLSLFLEMLGVDESEAEEEPQPDADADAWQKDAELEQHFEQRQRRKKQRRRRGRNPLPKNLPREEITLPVPQSHRVCSVCGNDKSCLGHDKSEVLEWVPGSFKVQVYAREKLACKPCQGSVTIAPVADKIIEGGLPGPALLTEIVLKKFKYAQPLWRQAEFFTTQGVRLAESTLCGWVKAVAGLLEPVYKEIKRVALLSHCINTDDSHIRVLDRTHPKGIKRGAMWVYVGDGLHAFFDYTPDRSRAGPARVLDGYTGYIQADAYSVYDVFFEGEEASCVEVGCAMHCRRYFVEALDAGATDAAPAIAWFRHLYKIEEYAKDIGADSQKRLELRQEKSVPVMEDLGKWIVAKSKSTTKDTPLGKALGYASRQWDALNQFLVDGALEIDNGLAERTIRTLAIGRKNYMFAGSDDGAQWAAILYSLIASCQLAKIDAGAYLRDVMSKIAAQWPQSRLAELTPARWAGSPRSTDPYHGATVQRQV